MDELITPYTEKQIEREAADRAEENHLYQAWFLRGVSDALANRDRDLGREDHLYTPAYMLGYEAIEKALQELDKLP